MKLSQILIAGLLAAGPALSAEAPPTTTGAVAKPSNPGAILDQAYYAIGLNLGRSLRNAGVDADPQKVLEGLKDGLSGATPPLTEAQMQAAVAQLQTQAQARAADKAAKAAEANKAQGVAFMSANKAKSGVVTLPSGLQYEILKAGSGPVPKIDDTVSCHYRGTLIDGTEFDSSYARNEPASFAVNGVIKGWTEALQRMPVGSKWRLVVPSDLAYGDRGAGAQIGPGAVLVFEVELLAIEPRT